MEKQFNFDDELRRRLQHIEHEPEPLVWEKIHQELHPPKKYWFLRYKWYRWLILIGMFNMPVIELNDQVNPSIALNSENYSDSLAIYSPLPSTEQVTINNLNPTFNHKTPGQLDPENTISYQNTEAYTQTYKGLPSSLRDKSEGPTVAQVAKQKITYNPVAAIHEEQYVNQPSKRDTIHKTLSDQPAMIKTETMGDKEEAAVLTDKTERVSKGEVTKKTEKTLNTLETYKQEAIGQNPVSLKEKSENTGLQTTSITSHKNIVSSDKANQSLSIADSGYFTKNTGTDPVFYAEPTRDSVKPAKNSGNTLIELRQTLSPTLKDSASEQTLSVQKALKDSLKAPEKKIKEKNGTWSWIASVSPMISYYEVNPYQYDRFYVTNIRTVDNFYERLGYRLQIGTHWQALPRTALRVGLTYTYFKQRLRYDSRNVDTEPDTIRDLTNQQKMNSLGIQVDAIHYFDNTGVWNKYLAIGGEAALQNNYFQYNIRTGIGLSYALQNNLHLYAEPHLVYYTSYTWRLDNVARVRPYQIGLSLGAKWKF